jgi:predicted DNA-binding WGR domain protein
MICVYLECHEGKSNKFYEIKVAENDVESRYGACGAAGVTTMKSFDTFEEARKFFDKTVAEKKKKGYAEVGKSVQESEKASEPEATNKKGKGKAAEKAPEPETTSNKGKGTKKEEVEVKSTHSASGTGTSTYYLECHEGKSNKFYEMILSGTEVTTRYGAGGAPGVSATKAFNNTAEAQKFIDKTLAEKKKKGYDEVSSSAPAADLPSASAASAPNTKKRGRGKSADEDEKETKKVKQESFFESQVNAVRSELEATAASRLAFCKEKEWTCDPRLAINIDQVTVKQLLTQLKAFNAATVDSMVKELKRQASEGEEAVEVFLTQVKEELGNPDSDEELFSEDQTYALAVHRFCDMTLANSLLEFPDFAQALTSAANAKQLGDTFKNTPLPFAKVLTKFPVPHCLKVEEDQCFPARDDISEEGNLFSL